MFCGYADNSGWLERIEPGEVRACHDVNAVNQAGLLGATNTPDALKILLARWKTLNDFSFKNGFE